MRHDCSAQWYHLTNMFYSDTKLKFSPLSILGVFFFIQEE